MVNVHVNSDIYDQEIRALLEVFLGKTQIRYLRNEPEEPDGDPTERDLNLSVHIGAEQVSAVFIKCGNTGSGEFAEEAPEKIADKHIAEAAPENCDSEFCAEVPYERSIGNPMREEKNAVKLAVYRVLEKAFGKTLPWGDLLGVRPVKLAVMMQKEGLTQEQTKNRLMRDYGVSAEKGALAARVAAKEIECVRGITGNDRYSLYIGIPFCPTRCLYCSFTSYPVRGNEDMIEPYLKALKKEIRATAEKCGGRKPVSVYMGGGTPSAISAGQLYELIIYIKECFGIDDDTEFTVEAGRPDSIDEDKLKALKASGINRISINPQTMKDETLRLMGRTHTFKDIENCYETAASMGFDNINMDLIMGLPGENADDARMSVRKVMELKPASVTVHTLALKKNSLLTLGLPDYEMKLPTSEMVCEMVENSRQMLAIGGYEEYYVYRQKNIGAGLENTGFALAGRECLYNILMMEELQTIVACGAGVVTKLVYDTENMGLTGNKSIVRVDNLKNLKEYIERIDDVIARKDILDSLWMKDM